MGTIARTREKRQVTMKGFFNVSALEAVLGLRSRFSPMDAESVPLAAAGGRILAEDIRSQEDLPGFSRSTMDGFAVKAASTFGASEGNPAYLKVVGSVAMGEKTPIAVGRGEAVRIATGGMMPEGADGVVMLEHAEALDDTTLEVYKSVAPGQHVIRKGEDVGTGDVVLSKGRRLRPQEVGLLAALGQTRLQVFRRPRVAILSTGDEVVPVDGIPGPGQVRDVNSSTLAELCRLAGAAPVAAGLVQDDLQRLLEACRKAAEEADAVLISGGSSVGARDLTMEILQRLPDPEVLVHGISISPGKPTILSRSGPCMIWGLPGHVTSAMVVFLAVVRTFIDHLSGLAPDGRPRRTLPAVLSRNLASAQGRTDFVRVRLIQEPSAGMLGAEPILGKSGLLHTMVQADGLVRIDANQEGLDAGTVVDVEPIWE